ncbi:alanine dehydrogenase [Xanthomonas translucens]|uniref:alanine dehydrogenase n=1 Tax=Xanthomonas campestris pv. translucens TaxID=343 RepID=UPI0002A79A0F|nr:alanine dehydrogenase [Xanthomonas translucens]AKK68129.1 alanine dehydrogenase [Xanthomonas translucens pv. undulosa]ELP96210.1 alanine dehydrogenase oxidoreductase [Xanthomonas translucens DAR61454]MBC3973492.1 alanine dehydrogenase [Xanthomonas translucens pv. undulosa]MCT8270055.1 alanine dehydrogenase [Xanthomonas translucens pv. undulosa]MCT8282348.1 alanine dehydrogenase [Xanthomonas translucens pv. undulosa]
MLVGVPKEIKNHEYRIGLTPAGVRELVLHGHQVLVQRDGGQAIGLTDADYERAGARLADDAASVFAQAEMIVKVKEPQPDECALLRTGQLLFTYLHLAPDPAQANALLQSGCTAIAYETVTDGHGGLPLLAPMSEVAGRMAIQAGAHALEKAQGGCGVLLGGVPGVKPAEVLVIGGGVVGINAARMAMGLHARVTVLDRSLERLKYLDELYGHQLTTLYSTRDAIEHCLPHTDLVIGAVLIPGAAAPKLVSRAQLALLRPGSVLVDVAIDQGGCFETSRATTHQQPTYEVDGIVHYCVANMPGGVARTSTFALTNATLPFVLQLAEHGLQALRDDQDLRNGLNVHAGKLTHRAVAQALGAEFVRPLDALG